MRQKSSYHFYLSWFLLLGMLFHVLVEHSDEWFETTLSSQGESQLALYHHDHLGLHAIGIDDHDNDSAQGPHHNHLTADHPTAYVCASTTQASDLLTHRLNRLFASVPLILEIPRVPLHLTSQMEFAEPQPPPEQRQRALKSTILLI